MKNLALNIIYILLCLNIFSCDSNNELLFVKDTRYSEPPFREYKTLNGIETYYLSERYFVFNYHGNKKRFKEASIDLLCKRIKDSTKLVGMYDVDFQDIGRFVKYNPQDVLSADFSTPLAFYTWDISNTHVIRVHYKGNFDAIDIDLDCTVDSKYLYNTSKLNPEH